jgi:pilus assembly protein Flp/PilA
MLSFFHRSEERGASAVEYGLLIAGIAAVIVVAVFAFGGVVKEALFDDTCTVINSQVAASASC